MPSSPPAAPIKLGAFVELGIDNSTHGTVAGQWIVVLSVDSDGKKFEQCEEWTKKAGSATVSDLAGSFDEVDFY